MNETLLKHCLRNKGVRIFPDWLVFVLKTFLRINEIKEEKTKGTIYLFILNQRLPQLLKDRHFPTSSDADRPWV